MTTKINIKPLGDRVLVKPIIEEKKKNNSGIIIPETVSGSNREKPEQGKVVAVGEGRIENGKKIPLNVKVGDKIIFSKYSPDEIKVDGEDLLILKEENILAIIK